MPTNNRNPEAKRKSRSHSLSPLSPSRLFRLKAAVHSLWSWLYVSIANTTREREGERERTLVCVLRELPTSRHESRRHRILAQRVAQHRPMHRFIAKDAARRFRKITIFELRDGREIRRHCTLLQARGEAQHIGL